MTTIVKADVRQLQQIAPLFDQYRVFYKQPSDLAAASKFLEERFANDESVIFLARENNRPVGFTQLYTSFSSVSLNAIYILNDLYVEEKYRGRGIGEALLNGAKVHCSNMGYKGLALETALDNPAQRLYEKLGWKKDTACFHYFWSCP